MTDISILFYQEALYKLSIAQRNFTVVNELLKLLHLFHRLVTPLALRRGTAAVPSVTLQGTLQPRWAFHRLTAWKGSGNFGAYLLKMRHLGITESRFQGITRKEDRSFEQRGLALCADLRACGRQSAAVDSDWENPADLQVSANDNVIFRSRQRLRQIVSAVVRFRNARAKRGSVPPNEKVVTSSHDLATAPASRIAKSELEKILSVSHVIDYRSRANK